MSTSYDIVTSDRATTASSPQPISRSPGKKVLVLERNAWFGGGVVTRELTRPGFRHDQHSMSHIFIQGNPLLLNDELGSSASTGSSTSSPTCR